MDRETLVDRLNDLLELETSGLTWRLSEFQSFIGWSDTRMATLFKQIITDGQDHQRWLIEEILRLGGSPRTVTTDIRLAGLHYVEARHLLPNLIEEKRKLVQVYLSATSDFPTTSEAIATLSTILSRHQTHLEQVDALAQQLAAPAPAPAAEPAVATSTGDDA